VAKITGKEGLTFSGPARVFNSEEETLEAIYGLKIKEGDVIVVRYEGPVGGPGMREMLKPTSAIMGQDLGDKVAFITDGRFSGGSHGFVVGHVTPEAAKGGLIGLLKDGDIITIDASKETINADISDSDLEERKKNWKNPKPMPKKGVLAKYAKTVKSASEGAVTD
jgi:dihydroxy-acid dehydratase